jgi:hypothetical protein
LEKHNDDKFTFYFIGVTMLFVTALLTGTILSATPLNPANLLVPAVFGFVGLIFLIGTYFWDKKW